MHAITKVVRELFVPFCAIVVSICLGVQLVFVLQSEVRAASSVRDYACDILTVVAFPLSLFVLSNFFCDPKGNQLGGSGAQPDGDRAQVKAKSLRHGETADSAE